MLESIKFTDGKLFILDQLLLPKLSQYIEINDVQGGYDAIKQMKVRGAPAIGIVAALSLAVELKQKTFETKTSLHDFVTTQMTFISKSRPTAVNLKKVCEFVINHSENLKNAENVTANKMRDSLITDMEKILHDDIKRNKAIGEFGGKHISALQENSRVTILTHCNTGSLATAGYGTALGIVRWLFEQQNLLQVFFTETRPYNQGSRLTAYELMYEKIPCAMICDNMVGALMKSKSISAVVVGADRVVQNGDTANKIGTYQIAVCAKHHGVPFYVACPRSSFDFSIENGNMIPIEERHADEIRCINSIPISVPNVPCWNPQFDITPAELITGGIVTECGVFPANSLKENKDILSSFNFLE